MFRLSARLPAITRGALRTSLVSSKALRPSTAIRALSTTLPRYDTSALSTVLTAELNYEKETAAEEGNTDPEFLEEFKSQGIWTIEPTPGSDEVILNRTYGNENIRVVFSIADLDDGAAAPEFTGEEEQAPEAEAADMDLAIDINMTITKNGATGSLVIDAVAQDGLFSISNIAHYKDAALALGPTAEDDWKRQATYLGPDFENLDQSLQEEFENYLEERGINTSLATFIPAYAEYKEQKEYVSWLESVKTFVEA